MEEYVMGGACSMYGREGKSLHN